MVAGVYLVNASTTVFLSGLIGDELRNWCSMTETTTELEAQPENSAPAYPQIDADDFARRFGLRGPNLMWLVGAGASASAGIPTAWDMVWEFKQQLFVHQRKATLKSVSDLANPAIRAQLQAHIDSSGTLPALESIEEYAALFETLYPAEGDRRMYLDKKMASARPSYGHVALACLMKADKASAQCGLRTSIDDRRCLR